MIPERHSGCADEPPVAESVTGRLAEFIAADAGWSAPAEIRELAIRHLLDTVASIVACGDLSAAQVARRFSRRHSGGVRDGVPILGSGERASLIDAVFASAMAGHAAEINDFSPSSFVQPGPAIVSAALCLGDRRGSGGAAVLRSVLAGYEVACRLPKALGIGNLTHTGLATHGIAPVFGAGAAAASLMGLTAEQIRHMLAACAQQASGSWQWLADVEHIEKAFVFAGMGARNGVQAALLVESGFAGVRDTFDHPAGWLARTGFARPDSDLDLGYLVDGLGTRWEMPLVGFKRFPVGGPTQPAVQAMLRLVRTVAPEKIARIRVEMPGRARAFAAAEMPALSVPYLCGVILTDGHLGFETAQSRERMTTDPVIRERMARVEVVHDPSQETEPRTESARVTATMADGSTETVFVGHVRGFPSHPMPADDVRAKALDLIAPKLGARRARDVIRLVWSIDDLKTVTPLIDAITPMG